MSALSWREGRGFEPAVARGRALDPWLLAVLVLAAVIRIVVIDNQSFWRDEALTVYEARLPFGAMINTVLHVETTPPLYFVVIWVWGHVFGTGEVALRSLSAVAGVGAVGVAYMAAQDLVSRYAGAIAGVLVGVSPFMVWYSQEARAYMVLCALSGAAFLWFIRAQRDPSPRNLVWWTIWSALALMTHFFAGFAAAPEAAWLLWRSRARVTVLAVAGVAVVQAAMLPFAFVDASHGTGWIAAIPKINRIGGAALEWGVSNLYRGATIAQGLSGAAAVIVCAGLLVWLGGDARTRAAAKLGTAVAASVIILPLILAYLGKDYWLARNVMPGFVPAIVVIAAACTSPRARLAGVAFALALCALFAWATARVQTQPSLQRANWRAVAQALGPAIVPRAILASGGPTADALKIYLPGVNWVQPRNRVVPIDEVDVVGAVGREALVSVHSLAAAAIGGAAVSQHGSPVPAMHAPPGAVLLKRVRIHSWILGEFLLRHPIHVTVDQLTATASRFFRRTPQALLVFFQRPVRPEL